MGFATATPGEFMARMISADFVMRKGESAARTYDHDKLVDDQTIWAGPPVSGIAIIEPERLLELRMRHGLVAEHIQRFEVRWLVPVQLLRGTLTARYRRLQAEDRRLAELVLAHGGVVGITASAEVTGIIAEAGAKIGWVKQSPGEDLTARIFYRPE
jgi:hypothetical protein